MSSSFLFLLFSLPQQASRCFLPSAALLCPSQPPISCLKKRKKEKNKETPPCFAASGGVYKMLTN
ncbi:unnamed protein product, partial [Vitis vinifera]|uniref:Secreted protein n=1 Tax=Vitis vinifera TaxID=29760 RepID=D7TZA3_VITVI